MIRHVIFDFDGTLVDSIDLLVQIGNDLAEKYKLKKMKREELMELNTLPIRDRLSKLGIPFYLLPKITLDVMGKYRQFAGALKITREIGELLKELKAKGMEMTIISSNSAGNIEKCLKANGVDGIDRICSSKGAMDKSPVIIKFLKETGAKNEEVIYVGDELRDIEACKKASIKIIAVTWGYDCLELLKGGQPDYIAERPVDIIEIINSAQCSLNL